MTAAADRSPRWASMGQRRHHTSGSAPARAALGTVVNRDASVRCSADRWTAVERDEPAPHAPALLSATYGGKHGLLARTRRGHRTVERDRARRPDVRGAPIDLAETPDSGREARRARPPERRVRPNPVTIGSRPLGARHPQYRALFPHPPDVNPRRAEWRVRLGSTKSRHWIRVFHVIGDTGSPRTALAWKGSRRCCGDEFRPVSGSNGVDPASVLPYAWR